MKNNENKDICSKCERICCVQMACMVDSNDVVDIKEMLATGDYCFDYWEGDIDDEDKFNRIYYLRPKHKGKEDQLVDASWGGECIFLTDDGCKLSWDKRPAQGKALIPDAISCSVKSKYSKRNMVKRWRERQVEILKILS